MFSLPHDDKLIKLSVGFEELAQLLSQRCERVLDGERLGGEYPASDEPITNELLERPRERARVKRIAPPHLEVLVESSGPVKQVCCHYQMPLGDCLLYPAD